MQQQQASSIKPWRRLGLRTRVRKTWHRAGANLNSGVKRAKRRVGIRQIKRRPASNNLDVLSAVMDSYGCDHWIAEGTLLGYVRSHDFLKHDGDVDIFVRMSTFKPQVFKALFAQGFRVATATGGRPKMNGLPDDGMKIVLERDGVPIDISFVYPRTSDTLYISVYHDWREGESGIIDFLYPEVETVLAPFQGAMVRVPRDPFSVVMADYGPGWVVPDLNWDYTTDPPNAVHRTTRLNRLESRNAICEYFQREAGLSLLSPDD